MFQKLFIVDVCGAYKGIVFRRKSIQCENVHKIIKLAMDVTTNGELCFIWNDNVHHRRLRHEQPLHFQQNLEQHILEHQ
jgi:hypothetical protein